MKKILEIEAKNSTPLLLGWYEPNKVDPMGIRITEIKGIWRWWARAIAGGVMLDKSELVPSLYPANNKSDVLKKVLGFVGRDLGFGCVSCGEKESAIASRYILRLSEVEKSNGKKLKLEDARKIQRIVLLLGGFPQEFELTQGEKECKMSLSRTGKDGNVRNLELYLPGCLKFKLNLISTEDNGNKERDKAAAFSLILSLLLMGIGKGGRKGLGSFDLVKINSNSEKLSEVINQLTNEAKRNNLSAIRKLISETYDSFAKLMNIEGGTSSDSKIEKLPLFPSLSKRESVSSVHVIFPIQKPECQELTNLHNMFLLSVRSSENSTSKFDDWRNCVKSVDWYFGLPRGVKKRAKYVILNKKGHPEGEARRPSAAVLSLHTEENLFGAGGFLTLFASTDWHPDLALVKNGRNIPIFERRIEKIPEKVKEAKKNVEGCLKKLSFCYKIEKAWPIGGET